MEKRLGKIEIYGQEYPLNFSVRIAQEFNGILSEKVSGDFAVNKQNIRLLALMMEDAAAFNQVVFGKETEPLTREQLEVILTPNDNEKVVEAINETVKLGGMRLVHAKPKNGEGPAEETEK